MHERLRMPEGGALVAAAARFLAEHPGAPRPCPPGVEGLAALADAIDRWLERDDVPALEDERFHEGAGAVLGLLVMEQLGGAHVTDGERHAVRVGQWGFFDPFAAVEDAMDHDDARASLVAHVDRAEAEAAARAGVGRVTRLLAERLGSRRITGRFGPQVNLDDGVELDLSQTLRATEGEAESAAREAVNKLVSMLPGQGGSRTLPWDEAAPRLMPRLVRPGFSAERQAGLLHRAVFGGALELTWVVCFSDRARFVNERDGRAWGQDRDGLVHTAVRNLAARSPQARFTREASRLVVSQSRDGLDGARLLLPTLHDVLAPELGSPFLCAVPHRDVLLASEAGEATTLGQRARADFERAPHPASPGLFEVSRHGVRPL